jgi:hypothetical protein
VHILRQAEGQSAAYRTGFRQAIENLPEAGVRNSQLTECCRFQSNFWLAVIVLNLQEDGQK